MRIVFIGAVEFSYFCLKEVLKNKGEVVGIATLSSSKGNSDYRDLTPIAKENDIDIFYFKNINDADTLEWIAKKRPDIVFCWGISQLIKNKLLSIPTMGVVGVHPALLPKNRGRHPLIWALALGLKESGLTFFFMDEGADSGPIISQKKFTITENDDASTLYQKIETLAAIQISEFLPQLTHKTYEIAIQNNTNANYWRKRNEKDGIIDWRMCKEAVINLVRALTRPYIGAEAFCNGQCIKIWKASVFTGHIEENVEPGKIIKILDGKPVIKCYDGAVVLKEWEAEIILREGDYME